jgi:hypothetical protein
VTKQPIDPAVVTATDIHGTVVAESITDIDGRYGFLLPDGTYTISVKKTNYEFPSTKMADASSDELYANIYHGEPVTITAGQVIDKNIPLDQKNFDWNEEAKRQASALSFHGRHEKKWATVNSYVYSIGLVISVLTVVLHQSTYNVLILILYAGIIALMNFGTFHRRLGRVTSATTHKPLSYAIIRVTAFDHETVLQSAVCDREGRYYCIVPKGKYFIDIEEKKSDGTYAKVYSSDLITSNSGILNSGFVV